MTICVRLEEVIEPNVQADPVTVRSLELVEKLFPMMVIDWVQPLVGLKEIIDGGGELELLGVGSSERVTV